MKQVRSLAFQVAIVEDILTLPTERKRGQSSDIGPHTSGVRVAVKVISCHERSCLSLPLALVK